MISVSDVLKHKGSQIWSLNVDASLREALALLAEKDVGALLILDGEKVAGIFSERDFARKLAEKEMLPMDTPINQLMTKDVFTVSPTDNIEQCMQLMTEKHIRHLPVLENNKLVGLISIGDVVKHLISHQKSFISQLENYISGRW